jgi:hypothetical protein
LHLHTIINHLRLPLNIFATISCVDHICNYITTSLTIVIFLLPCEQHIVWISSKKNHLCRNPMNMQMCILCILKGVVEKFWIYKCIFWIYMNTMDLWIYIKQPYYRYIQKLLLALNGFHIMDTLGIYFKYFKVLCNILRAYTSLYKLSYYTSWNYYNWIFY